MVLPYVITNAVEITRPYAIQALGYGSHVLNRVSDTPVPEVPGYVAPLALFAALAVSVWVLRKRNLNNPILMK